MNKRRICLWLALFSLLSALIAATETRASATGGNQSETVFVDVPVGSYCYDAVYWANQKGITNGTDSSHFSPAIKCSRANIITFIWRYSGSPAPNGVQPYGDVPSGSYYERAAHWANIHDYEEGETRGGELCFMGKIDCTRLAAVTYLWKLAGRPSGFEKNADRFSDVKDSALETRKAVGWAFAKNITKGTSETSFSPESTCTRGQIVTFLYRYHSA